MPVAQHWVAQRARLVETVELEVVPVVVGVGDGLEVRVAFEGRELRLGQAPGSVEVAGLEVGDHGVGILIHEEVDVVDGRLGAPVGGVAHHVDVAALLELDGLERPAADERQFGVVAVRGDLRGNVLPDVLGNDRHPHALEVGLGVRADDAHRSRVEGDRALDAVSRVREVGHAVLDDVLEREGHVGGRQRHAVLPLDARADVDRPGLAVGRDAAVLGGRKSARQIEGGLVAIAVAEQQVVVQRPDLVGLVLVADERVQVVGLLSPADLQCHAAGAGRGRGAGGKSRRQTPHQAAGQENRERKIGKPAGARQRPVSHGVPPVVAPTPIGVDHGSLACENYGAQGGPNARQPRRAGRDSPGRRFSSSPPHTPIPPH